MKEILTLGIGGFGINSLDLINQDLSEDHNIGLDGQVLKEDSYGNHYPETYFQEMSNGKYCARSLLIDGDDMAIDNIRSGDSANMYMLDNYSYSNIQSGGLFSKGCYSVDSDFIESVKEKVRKSLEMTNQCLSVEFHFAFGGGIGSGLGSKLLQEINENFKGFSYVGSNLLSNLKFSQHTLEPYNTCLSMNNLVEFLDGVTLFDNYALNNVCQRQFKIPQPSFEDFNTLISQYNCTLTSTLRHPSTQMKSYRQILTSTIPFPRIHFMSPSLGNLTPMFNEEKEKQDEDKIIEDLFDCRNFLLDVNPKQGRYYTYASIFRGKKYSDIDIKYKLRKNQSTNSSYFVEWLPDHNATSVISRDFESNPTNQAVLYGNNSAVKECFTAIGDQFTKLFRRKCYLHKYLEDGMDEMEFTESESALNDLISEYQPFNNSYGEEIEEDEY
eukprot:403372941